MMVNDVKVKLQTDHNCHLSSIKEASYDQDNSCYLCNSLKEAYNYDSLIGELFPGEDKPASPDAVFFDNKINFVEFKNGVVNSKEKTRIKLKAVEGLYQFYHQICPTHAFSLTDKMRYILVYNESKNPLPARTKIGEHLAVLANEHVIRFGLARLKSIYFDEVLTYTETEFVKEFLRE